MKITSAITTVCIILILLAIVAKAFDIPGVSIVLILTSGIASILFFLEILLSIFYFKGHSRIMLLSVISCLGLSNAVTGVLFRFMFWPNWQAILIAGLPLLVAGLILIATSQSKIKNLDLSKRNVLNRAIVLPVALFLLIGIAIWIVPEDAFWRLFSSRAIQ